MIEVKALNSNNEIIKCDQCDKDAGFVMATVDKQVALCIDHTPLNEKINATFVYRPSNYDGPKAEEVTTTGYTFTSNPEFIGCTPEEWLAAGEKSDKEPITTDYWVVNLRNK